MTAEEVVTDAFLRSVLDLSTLTRQQCLDLLNLLPSRDDDGNGKTAGTLTNPARQADAASRMEQRKLLDARMGQLRGLNRRAASAVRRTKQETAEARAEVDTLLQQLQNLYYEQRHLRGEIWACEAYDHKYQQLPLIPEDQFLAERPELQEADENAVMVARIEHELAEREALEAERQGLLKKKQGLIADNKKRKEDLASLDQDLEKFIDAAKPIQRIFEKEY